MKKYFCSDDQTFPTLQVRINLFHPILQTRKHPRQWQTANWRPICESAVYILPWRWVAPFLFMPTTARRNYRVPKGKDNGKTKINPFAQFFLRSKTRVQWVIFYPPISKIVCGKVIMWLTEYWAKITFNKFPAINYPKLRLNKCPIEQWHKHILTPDDLTCN